MPVKIAPEIQNILRRCRVEGDKVFLPPDRLERKTYEAVNKAFDAIGGKWNRSAGAHLFPRDVSEDFLLMVETGEYVDAKKELSFFPTPPEVVARMIELADRHHEKGYGSVLEPSAGDGAIVLQVANGIEVSAVEIDEMRAAALRLKFPDVRIHGADFLKWVTPRRFDLVLMNPPFNKRDEDEHVKKAFSLLLPDGVLVAILPEGWFFRQDKKATAFRSFLEEHSVDEEKLDRGTFRASGTGVPTRIVVLRRPE